MDADKIELLKRINIEDVIWVIYLVIIGLIFYSNHMETDYITTGSEENKKNIV